VLWSLAARNVCGVVPPPRLVKSEKQSLTLEQAHRLLESVRGHRLEMLLTLALTTGLRRGEMLAIRWTDVDLEHQTVKVQRTVAYILRYGYVENEQKTAAGRRVVLLPSFVVDMLKEHRVEQLEARLKVGSAWEDRDLLFTDLRGGYFNPRYLGKSMKRVIAEAGLPPDITLHTLRHSAATILLSMGVPLKVIQELLGHSSYAITADIYTDVLPSMQKEAMGKWDDVVKSDEQDDEQVQ
jgi:integrase